MATITKRDNGKFRAAIRKKGIKKTETFGTNRPSMIPYDFTPQLRAMQKPEELSVTPPNNLEWHLTPDKFRTED